MLWLLLLLLLLLVLLLLRRYLSLLRLRRSIHRPRFLTFLLWKHGRHWRSPLLFHIHLLKLVRRWRRTLLVLI